MNNKQTKRKQIRRLKKILKTLFKLQRLNYNSSYVLLNDLISEAKDDLKLYGVIL